MLRHGRLTHGQRSHEVLDRLLAGSKLIEYLPAARLREDLDCGAPWHPLNMICQLYNCQGMLLRARAHWATPLARSGLLTAARQALARTNWVGSPAPTGSR